MTKRFAPFNETVAQSMAFKTAKRIRSIARDLSLSPHEREVEAANAMATLLEGLGFRNVAKAWDNFMDVVKP
jgi:hypothetical protein